MRPRTTNLWLTALTILLAIAALASCKSGKGGDPTSPGSVRELDSGDFGAGGRYQHRFAAAGNYDYHCIHHAAMTGSVLVSATATDTLANVSIASSTAPFPAASVKPGGRVVWTNNTAMLHTVTSD